MTEMIERICRIKAARHYAKRFGKPEADEHVQANVDANWNIFLDDVQETIQLMREPTEEMRKACHGEAVSKHWHLMIDAALGRSNVTLGQLGPVQNATLTKNDLLNLLITAPSANHR